MSADRCFVLRVFGDTRGHWEVVRTCGVIRGVSDLDRSRALAERHPGCGLEADAPKTGVS